MRPNYYILILTIIVLHIFSTSVLNAQQLIFTENETGNINKSWYTGNNKNLVINSGKGIYGVAYDATQSKIYATNVLEDKIISVNSDGSNPVTILDKSTSGIDIPRGITLNGNSDKLYWAENGSGKIRSCNLDGTGISDVISNLISPVDVALDLVNNKLYWSDNGKGAKKISRSNLDGSMVEDIVTGLENVSGIDVDGSAGKIYWCEFGSAEKVMRANLDGTMHDTIANLLPEGSLRGISVDFQNNKLFWSNLKDSSITSANLDGSSQAVILSSLSSPLGLATDWTSALPVELTKFEAEYSNQAVNLFWETATEVDNYGFEIERKKENNIWEKIGFVPGHGNSNSPKSYSFTDKNVAGKNINYRLKQIDFSGTFEYSFIVEVILDNHLNFKLSKNYPNPFNPTTTIKYSLPKEVHVTLAVFNSLGQNVDYLVNEVQEQGVYSVKFNASKLSSGIYFYRLQAGEFISTNKMILIK